MQSKVLLTTARPEPLPAPTLQAAPTRVGPPPLLLSLLTAGLLWLCYFPADCGYLAWAALVPFLCLVRLRRRWLYWSAYAGALAFYAVSMQWIRVADPRMYATWIILSFYCALYFPVILFVLRYLDRRSALPLVVTLPALWTALELLRANFCSAFDGGFPWYFLAHTQHNHLGFIQVSDLTGAYGVSFVLAAANALLFEVLYSLPRFRRRLAGPAAPPRWSRMALLTQGLGVAGLVVAVGGYGLWRLGQDHFAAGPRIALVQGNLDQRIRNESSVSEEASRTVAQHYFDVSDLAAWTKPDLIAWPETSWPYSWTQIKPDTLAPASTQQARIWADRWHTPLLLGVNAYTWSDDGRERRYNSAVLLDAGGQPRGRYDKIHRVPFGEYVPLRDWLPSMNRLAPYDYDYSVWPGQDFTRFTLKGVGGRPGTTFGVLICYEDTDPSMARPYGGGDGKPAAGFVLNISNDGWFNGTSEHEQHLAVCRFRAVECRRAVARSVNMGISAVIDGNGRVLVPRPLTPPDGARPEGVRLWQAEAVPGAPGLSPSRWAQFKKVPGVLVATVPLDDRISLYARWGDWLPYGCAVLMGVAALWRRPRSRPALALVRS
jgi:apolipoprotein N-acyltransferase